MKQNGEVSRFSAWGPGTIDFSNEPAQEGRVDIPGSDAIDVEFASAMRANGASEEEIVSALRGD